MQDDARIKEELIEVHGLQCWGCDLPIQEPKQLELDHIVPLAAGGSHTIENRALLCTPCNRQKGDKLTIIGLRADIKSGKDGRTVNPSTLDLNHTMNMNRMRHEKSLSSQPLQSTFPLEEVMEDMEKALPPLSEEAPSHPNLMVRRTIRLLRAQGYEDIATALQHATTISPSSSHSYMHSCKIYFMDGEEASIVTLQQAMEGDTRAIFEAVALSYNLRAAGYQDGYDSDYAVEVAFTQEADPVGYGNDDIDDLPF